MAIDAEIHGTDGRSRKFQLTGVQAALGDTCRGVLFHVRLVRVIHDQLDPGLALASGLVRVGDGVVATKVAIDILERVLAGGGLESVGADPAPNLAIPRVRAERDRSALCDLQVERLVPAFFADLDIGDNLRAAARGYDLLAVAYADRIGNVDDARFKVRCGATTFFPSHTPMESGISITRGSKSGVGKAFMRAAVS